MAVNKSPILKRCRTLGISPGVLGYSKESRRNPKGNTRRKLSGYGTQLREKQKAKFIYGILEKQFYTMFAKAVKMPGPTGENLMVMLERRLDNIAFVLGFGDTRRQARQYVTHGHVMVNGRVINVPSYLVKVGDVVAIRPKSRSTDTFKALAESPRVIPAWITGSTAAFEGKIERFPTREEIDVPVNETLIVELYSK